MMEGVVSHLNHQNNMIISKVLHRGTTVIQSQNVKKSNMHSINKLKLDKRQKISSENHVQQWAHSSIKLASRLNYKKKITPV